MWFKSDSSVVMHLLPVTALRGVSSYIKLMHRKLNLMKNYQCLFKETLAFLLQMFLVMWLMWKCQKRGRMWYCEIVRFYKTSLQNFSRFVITADMLDELEDVT